MKKVEAIIRKSKFDEVKKALHEIEVNFFSYWDVTGVGNEKQGSRKLGDVTTKTDTAEPGPTHQLKKAFGKRPVRSSHLQPEASSQSNSTLTSIFPAKTASRNSALLGSICGCRASSAG